MRIVFGAKHIVGRKIASGIQLLVSGMLPFIGLFIQYPGIFNTLGLTLAILLSLYCLISHSLSINRPFAIFSVLYLARIFLNFFLPHGSFSQENIMSFLIVLAVAGCSLILSGFVDQEILFRVWRFTGILVMIAMAYQLIQLNLPGSSVHVIKLLPVSLDDAAWTQKTTRPAAFFTEPAVLSVYLSPLLHMSLYRRKFVFAAFVSATILLSTSTIGIFSVAVLWFHFVIVNRKMPTLTRTILLIVSFLLALSVFSLTVFSPTLSKLALEIEGTTNSYMRTIMGYDYYIQLTRPEQIFGTFEPSVRQLLLSGRINIPAFLDREHYSYVNSIQQLLLTGGLVGVILLFWMYYRLLRSGSSSLRGYLLLQIILMFGSRMFYNALSLIPYIFMLSLCDRSDHKCVSGSKRFLNYLRAVRRQRRHTAEDKAQ